MLFKNGQCSKSQQRHFWVMTLKSQVVSHNWSRLIEEHKGMSSAPQTLHCWYQKISEDMHYPPKMYSFHTFSCNIQNRQTSKATFHVNTNSSSVLSTQRSLLSKCCFLTIRFTNKKYWSSTVNKLKANFKDKEKLFRLVLCLLF